ncbi:hypothetical protein PS928_05855 [Pseudomonas fluorescens]|jgi:long-chain fatty acid transport protein|uniref:Uncharacterized protein n=1 Tax=Pseudomonas fluorescens TaxID=294 RepID=A0A5E7VQ75_PSEFL|nr:hypothetical protein PS928_05855 [Pseudomonas fluorescens]
MLYEIGTDNVGLANAGSAARAQGPSTIASNPAGMSYLPGTQITGGLQVRYGNLKFNRDDDTNVVGSGSGAALDPMPGASFADQIPSRPYISGAPPIPFRQACASRSRTSATH